MKPTIRKQTVTSQGIKESVSFGIKKSGLHHILGILRNQLYSDKILAVIREYTCNGVDAHVEQMCPERPVEVTLPNRMSPYFKVRDFGPALSDEDIHNVYAFYGESTKRNSNDQIGMLGIGSKSAFAYGDNFVINSFLDGKKHSYNAYIDDTQVGQISKLSTEDCDEEQGIEIVVPVKTGDYEEFRDKARDLFRWFNVRPIVKGVQKFEYSDSEILFSGDDWEWNDNKHERYGSYGNKQGEAVAVMGNIGYPLNEYSLNIPSDDEHEGLSSLLCDNLILNVDIGDLEISASRENLQYTDYTREQIIKKLKKVRSEIKETVLKQFKNVKTMFEAKCLYGSVFDYGSPLYALRDVLAKQLKFNGEFIKDDTFSFYNVSGIDLRNFPKSYRGHRRHKPEECNKIDCNNKTVIIENDVGHRRGLMGRILPIIIDQNKSPYLIEYTGESETLNDGSQKITTPAKAKAYAKKKLGFDAPVLKLSELEKKPLSDYGYGVTSSGGSAGTKNKKHSATCFKFDLEAASSSRGYGQHGNSQYWNVISVDIENDSGIYTVMDKFIPIKIDNEYNQECRIRDLHTILDGLKQLGVKLPTIHGFKIKQKDKVVGKDNWQSVWDWAEEKMQELISSADLQQMYVDREYALKIRQCRNDNDFGLSTYFFDWLDKSSYGEVYSKLVDRGNSLFVSFANKYQNMKGDGIKKNKIDAFREISKTLNKPLEFKDIQPSNDLVKLGKKLLKQYGMLVTVDSNNWSWHDSEQFQKTLTNYINVIDVCTIAKQKLPAQVL
jgi:hypothetical protein